MYALALGIVLLGGWEIVCQAEWVDPLILPAPSAIAESLVDDRDLLFDNALPTLIEAASGLAAAALVGIVVALGMHLYTPVRRALYPYVVGSQALPIPVLAPALIFALGFGLLPKIFIVALICFFPITINLFDALRSTDPDQRKLLASLQASRWQTLVLFESRAALPGLFTGLRLAAAVSVIGAVFAEAAGAEEGLGRLITTSQYSLTSELTFAATVLLFVLALALYGAVTLAERLLVTWLPRKEA